MNYYVDIKLFEDTEITLGFVWKKLYAQVHLALVEVRDENNLVSVGLAFPKYKASKFPLGNELRIFAHTKDELESLDLNRWLERLLDYVVLSEIKTVPTDINEYASFGRKQFKVNAERLARRQAKRKGISLEEALKNYESFDEEKKKTKLPFINIKSFSSDREMKIFIQKSKKKEAKEGLFSTYGLSNEATVPWF